MKSIAHILIILLISFSATANANKGVVFVGEESYAALYDIASDDVNLDDNDPFTTPTNNPRKPQLTVLAFISPSTSLQLTSCLFETVSIRAPPLS